MSRGPKRVSVLVCFAVREEAVFALPLPPVNGGAESVITGMGRDNAGTRFKQALETVQPGLVLTCGFAGALQSRWDIGDILFDEDEGAGLGATLESLGARRAAFHCSDRVAVTAAEKTALCQRTGADAVEMESSAIRALCHERGIPSATIRVISDRADKDLPLDFNALLTADQRLSMWKLSLALVRAPASIPRLIGLQRDTRKAARELAVVLRGLISVLPPGGRVGS